MTPTPEAGQSPEALQELREAQLGPAMDLAIRDNDDFKALVVTVAKEELPTLETLFEVAGTIVGFTLQYLTGAGWGPTAAHPTKDFAEAWASKCEDLARETAKVTALIGVIRRMVESSRPGTTPQEREEAWAAVGAITLVDEARADEDFMARLERVRERYARG